MSELEIWNELGNIYYNAGSYDEAIRAYHKAIELDHGCGQSFSNLASIYIHKEYYAEAILMYQKGIELLKNNLDKALLWNRLGDAYLLVDDYDNAFAAYQSAVELDPENTALKNDLAKVKLGAAHSLSTGFLASQKTAPETEIIQASPASPEPPVVEPAYLQPGEMLTTAPDPLESEVEVETAPEMPAILPDPAVSESTCPESEEVLATEPASQKFAPGTTTETVTETETVLEMSSTLPDPVIPESVCLEETLTTDPAPQESEIGPGEESLIESETVPEIPPSLLASILAESVYPESPETLAADAGLEEAGAEAEIDPETLPEALSDLSLAADESEPETACWVFKAHELDLLVETDENSSTEKPPLILGSRVLSEETDQAVAEDILDKAEEVPSLVKNDVTDAPEQNIPGILTGTNSADIKNQNPLDHTDKNLPLIEPKMGEPMNSRANALLKLGLLHWRRADYEGAVRFLKTALNLAAVFSDNQFEALCFNAIALVETDLGKTEEAIQAYENAASLDPVHIFPWNNLGYLYSQGDRYEEAQVAFKKAIEHNPKDPLSWNGLGDVYHKLGRNEEAISAYQLGNVFDRPFRNEAVLMAGQVAPDTDGEDPRILEEMGNINFMHGAYDDAINAFSNAIELLEDTTDKARLWKRLGDAYQRLNEIDNATAAYHKAAELDPENAALLNNETRTLPESASIDPAGSPETSQTTVEAAQEAADPSEPLDSSADLPESEETGTMESDPFKPEPVEEARTIPHILPFLSEPVESPEPEAAYWVFKDGAPNKDVHRPQTQFRSAREPVGNTKPSPTFVMPKFTGQALLDNPLLTDTIDDATVMVVEQTPLKEAAARMGYVQPFIPEADPDGTFSEAEPVTMGGSLQEPVNLDNPAPAAVVPIDPIASQIGANIHTLEKDIAAYRKVTEINPLNDRAWDALGNMYEATGLHNEAINAFEKAISLASQREVYHYHLGLAFAAQKRYDKAIRSLQKVVALNPDYMLAHCALAGYYRRIGKEAEAKEHIAIARPYIESENDYNQACFESICGNTDRALTFLKDALDKKQIQVDLVHADPDLDFIRNDPRFEDLINRTRYIKQ